MRTMRGANRYADRSVVVASVHGTLGPADWPAARDLLDRLLPPGIDASRLGEPPDRPAAAIEAIADQICAWAGFPPATVGCRPIAHPSPETATMPAGFEPLTVAAMTVAGRLLTAARGQAGQSFVDRTLPELIALKAEADDHLRTTRRYIARAAEERGLSARPFTPSSAHVLIGEGRFGRLFDGASTWATSAVGLRLAGNKTDASRMLDRAGVPVGRQLRIESLDAARAAVERLGLPMVIKPVRSRRQGGVSFVYRKDELDAGYAHSTETSTDLVAESFIPGNEYRALVIAGEVVSVIQHRPANVVGDGRSTIAALVAEANADRRRGPRSHGHPMCPIPWDELTQRFLAWRGLRPDDVPPAGARIETYPLGMMRVGGDPQIEVVDSLHPATRAMLERAVAVFRLDVAGIDLRTPDPARDWREVGAGICEVNPQPQIGIHYNVQEANARDVAGILLDRIYPPEERGQMRHVVVAAPRERAEAARAIAAALTGHLGWRVGIVSGIDLDLAGYRPGTPPASFRRAQLMAIEDRSLDAAVHLIPPHVVRRAGLGVARADLVLVAPDAASDPSLAAAVRLTAENAGARLLDLPTEDSEAARIAVETLAAGAHRRAAD